MPTRRKTKRATPLATLPLVAPGFQGLNTELPTGAGFNEINWAAVMDNAVFDDLGRLSLRQGYVNQTNPLAGVNYTEADTVVAITIGTSGDQFGLVSGGTGSASPTTIRGGDWTVEDCYYDVSDDRWIIELVNASFLTEFNIPTIQIEHESGSTETFNMADVDNTFAFDDPSNTVVITLPATSGQNWSNNNTETLDVTFTLRTYG